MTHADPVKDFFAQYPLKKFGKGELIVFGDNNVPPVTYLVSGKVSQYDISEEGHKLVLTIYKPGAFFPMAHAVNNTPNRYFFEALEPVEVRQAPAADAAAFVREHPDVLFDLLQRLYRGMDGLLGRLAQLMAGTAQGLLLHELSIMQQRFGERRDNGTFVKATAAELAAQTGLARETVSRELQKCTAKGMLEVVKGGILIKNIDAA